jgi:hypothetical protein
MQIINPKVYLLVLLLLLVLFSCEDFKEEEEVLCLPTNMTTTLFQGTNSSKIIADFHYVSGTEFLDHITWSTYQTHYFEYDGSDRLKVVRKLKVKEKVQEERWFVYDGPLTGNVMLVKRNLDYSNLEPLDSVYTGYIAFEYEAGRVIAEHEYAVDEEGEESLVRVAEYAYDNEGNILTRTTSLLRTGEEETVEMTYDTSKHPFSGLLYYFTGESFVNNMLNKSSGFGDTEYQYKLELNAQGYPETVYEKLGSTNTGITRYSYRCQ